jgi:hypothetical protein
MDVINEHIPLVKRRVKNKRLQVWMTQDILHQIGIRDKFKARAKHNYLIASVIYKRIRNDVVKQIANAKSNYIKQKILENKDNIKNLWKLLKEIAPTKPVAHIPACIHS